MAGVHSIKTRYRGVLFMSTLEADWAKTLDNWAVNWSYEPQGVVLPDGQNYRPDMLLPRIGTWLEVKGPHNQRIDKPELLAQGCLHAPGCPKGDPEEVLHRPVDAPGAVCPCGYGKDMPWMMVVVGRPNQAGRACWEAPRGCYPGMRPIVTDCPTCHQRSWHLLGGAPVCRRCHHLLPQPVVGWVSGTLGFAKIEPPRGARKH